MANVSQMIFSGSARLSGAFKTKLLAASSLVTMISDQQKFPEKFLPATILILNEGIKS